MDGLTSSHNNLTDLRYSLEAELEKLKVKMWRRDLTSTTSHSEAVQSWPPLLPTKSYIIIIPGSYNNRAHGHPPHS
ncbi:hypothetical protein GDO78_014961 [Eleutherodactylus coqui]|uniref:Uncharacterized protein n=1 Tax=Eleutherodactylus coqui TaxID=57060 RepID=A0A8J6E6T0_ELECQ|nr:hypothetical protein GDO78_014961 [Eleutherodactylus coqui]